VRVSPLARKIAAELGIDPATVLGTGPGGAVGKEDIERAAAGRAASTAPATESDRRAAMRRAIAAAMSRSKREIPHYYLSTTIDLHRSLLWLEERNRSRPVESRLLPGVLLLKAAALALREAPELNATWQGEGVVPGPGIHLGVAISLRGGGLVAPALHDADRAGLDELMERFRDLVSRARAGSLRSSELSDPTITVTSLGDQGV
jgi:pyruvate dehydrogenase E2 component (dihydrolipoamide acetyltransferase)